MSAVHRQELLDQLAHYGYPVMPPMRRSDPETVLELLVRQTEPRLMEGFPVVLLNALRERATLKWELSKWHPEDALGANGSKRLAGLLAVSYLLFRLFGVDGHVQERVMRLLSKFKEGAKTLKDYEQPFLASTNLTLDGQVLSSERWKNTFRRYYLSPRDSQELEKRTHALQLELLLSTIFTPRQKELLRKRAERAPMTPTERNYYYRTVNKRLKVLANEEVHHMARQMLNR